MVLPVFKNQFKIQTAAATTEPLAPAVMSTISDMESFSVSMDNGVEEYNPLDAEGWVRRLMTSKSFSISLSGKRNFTDNGNNYIAGLAWRTGTDCNSVFEWVMADGKTTVKFDCVINVSSLGGDSTAIDALECEIMSNGKPTITIVA